MVSLFHTSLTCLILLFHLRPPDHLNMILLVVPKTRLEFRGDWAFLVVAPKLWSKLPLNIRQACSVAVFLWLLVQCVLVSCCFYLTTVFVVCFYCFQYTLVQFPGSDAASPADDGRRDQTFHNRLVEDLQHLAANTEGPKLPQEVQSALSLLVDGFTVASPL
ncbi:hypothetical protein AMECASPLE_033024 [Ameca splendens]|uniref:Uncharacterized protein n=1 Tax=Ameca splendens TaxID=208324 RepID=A0ABV0XJN7_9TELE